VPEAVRSSASVSDYLGVRKRGFPAADQWRVTAIRVSASRLCVAGAGRPVRAASCLTKNLQQLTDRYRLRFQPVDATH